METLNRVKTGKKSRPVRVVQFGEGNFLRAFVDYMIDIANEQGTFDGDIVLIKPIEFGNLDNFRAQECQYTVSLRGNVNGEGRKINRIVTSVDRAVDAISEYDDYMKLAEDIYDFQSEDTRNNVRLRWGQDFYYNEKGEE